MRVAVFQKKQPNPPPFTYKKAHLAMCFLAGKVDSFNSVGLALVQFAQASAPKGGSTRNACGCFSKKTA